MPSVLDPTALTTLVNLKEVLGIASSDTTKDNAIERVINRTTLFLEGETHRKLKGRRYGSGFTGTTHTTTSVPDEDYIYFSGSTTDRGGDTLKDPNGYGVFYLPAYPIRSNTETGSVTFVLSVLSVRSSSGETWDATALTEFEDYIVNRETGELRLLGGCFTPGNRNYRVTMCAGYVTVPADLDGLCLELCKQVFRESRNLQSESIGTWSRTFNLVKEDPYVAGLLSRFTRFVL